MQSQLGSSTFERLIRSVSLGTNTIAHYCHAHDCRRVRGQNKEKVTERFVVDSWKRESGLFVLVKKNLTLESTTFQIRLVNYVRKASCDLSVFEQFLCSFSGIFATSVRIALDSRFSKTRLGMCESSVRAVPSQELREDLPDAVVGSDHTDPDAH